MKKKKILQLKKQEIINNRKIKKNLNNYGKGKRWREKQLKLKLERLKNPCVYEVDGDLFNSLMSAQHYCISKGYSTRCISKVPLRGEC